MTGEPRLPADSKKEVIMNIRLQNSNPMSVGWNLLSGGGLMKSTAQKLERQGRRDSQVAFFENQKKNLKNIEC